MQIFSINMKAIGGSLVTLVSWLGSFAISYSFSFLMDWSSAGNSTNKHYSSSLPVIIENHMYLQKGRNGNHQIVCSLVTYICSQCCCVPTGTFFMFSAASLATILFVARLVPETKGRTLEEIQDSLNSRR
jgi:SP family facilitated glucose transporter-like MFS transporter 8